MAEMLAVSKVWMKVVLLAAMRADLWANVLVGYLAQSMVVKLVAKWGFEKVAKWEDS